MAETCRHCGHPNLDGAKYCTRCTKELALTCSDCSHENPHGSKFCAKCGTALETAPESVAASGPGKWLHKLGWIIPIGALVGFLFWKTTGTGSAKGEVRSRGKPFGDYAMQVEGCFSGARENFFGAWVTPKLEDKGSGYGAKGGLKLVKNMVGEWDVYVESPSECEGYKCKTRPLDAKACTVFDVDVHDTQTSVNDVIEREGHARLTCSFPDGGALTANVTFDGCH